MEKIYAEAKRPFYSEVQSNISDIPEVATIEASSPWQGADVSFNYAKVDYPKLHTHHHWELFIILSGRVIHEINGQTFAMGKGDACLVRPRDWHQLYDSAPVSGENYQIINIVIRTEHMERQIALLDAELYDQLISSPEPLVFHLDGNLLVSVIRQTIAIQSLEPTPDDLRACKIVFSSLVLEFLKGYANPESKYPDWLLDFLVLLQDADSFSVRISQLAQTTPYSYSRLVRIFKSYIGISLVEYITNIKISYAKSLLRNTDMTILSIASLLDYSISYFNKLFKREVGVTPGEYRKLHQQDI